MSVSDKKKDAQIDKNFYSARRKIMKEKIMKPVRWNGLEFESAAALGRHLRSGIHDISGYIRRKRKLRGHVPVYIPKDE